MSRIKFLGLGGLGENGKNMFVVEVDERIFILDAGQKHPSVDLYGIDTVMPDISYLLENKSRVQGIFLTHCHYDHIGAVPELLKNLDVGVFGTHFTISLVEELLNEQGMNVSKYRLYRINQDKVLKFGPISVEFFNLSHNVPENVGISINTEDGSLVYAPDFTFTTNIDKRYSTGFVKLADISKHGVLALMSESLGTSNVDRVSNDYQMNYRITEILQSSKRVIFSMFSSDLDRVQKVVNLCVQQKRKIAIIGRKVQKIINIAMNSDYLKIPQENLVNLKYMDELNSNDDPNLAVIVTGLRHEPYFMLQRMARGQDRLVQISESDHVVILAPPVVGTEKMEAKTLDVIYKQGAKLTLFKKGILRSSHADGEDLKMMYDILNPKYIIPVIGEYRHQYMQKSFALEAGYEEDKILVLDNGEVVVFENGELTNEKDKVQVGDVLVDGSIIGDINEVVLKDRELLSSDGVLIAVINIDARRREIISKPTFVSRGFVSKAPLEELSQELEEETYNVINTYFRSRYIDWNELKLSLRDAYSKVIYTMTKKNPIIIPNVIDIDAE